MDAEERQVLISFYKSNGGDSWKTKNGWCTDAPLSKWHRVKINKNGSVFNLDLPGNNLIGEAPPFRLS